MIDPVFFSTVFIAIFLGMLAFAGALVYRARWPQASLSAPILTDDMVRQIEQAGYIDLDEPLDLEQIQDEEARFWEDEGDLWTGSES